MARVCVTDFGALPDNEVDQTAAFRLVTDHVRANPGTDLIVPPGRYLIHNAAARRQLDDVMYGRVRWADFEKPYVPYFTGLDLSGLRDVTVNAEGAELVCDGWMEPVSLSGSQNVTLRGLTISYRRPPASHGRIVGVHGEFYDVQFDDDCPVESGLASPRVLFRHPQTGLLGVMRSARSEMLGPQHLRFHRTVDTQLLGARVAFSHTGHFRAAVMAIEARDLLIEGVTIHDHGGMGVVGHRCDNVTLRDLRVVPRGDRCLSTNTDSSHFTSCTGRILIERCTFRGGGDDSANIHNYYYTPRSRRGPNQVDLVVATANGGTHAHVLDAPDVGDRLIMVDRRSLRPLDEFTVTAVRAVTEEWRAEVTFNAELPADLSDRLFANVARQPSVHVRDCTMEHHRARGLLIKTSNVVIERNRFVGLTGTGIHLGAEAHWHEASPCANVVIRENHFVDCGRGEGTIEGAAAVAVTILADRTDVCGLHRDIVIERNICENHSPRERGIVIANTRGARVANNRIENCAVLVFVRDSEDVSVSG